MMSPHRPAPPPGLAYRRFLAQLGELPLGSWLRTLERVAPDGRSLTCAVGALHARCARRSLGPLCADIGRTVHERAETLRWQAALRDDLTIAHIEGAAVLAEWAATALLVREGPDGLSETDFTLLYAPFAPLIPLASLEDPVP